MDDASHPARCRETAPAGLPEMCATIMPNTLEPIVVKRGQSGHWPLPDGMTIERVNQVFKATPPQIAAMLVGSMFGWDVPGADPDRYDVQGRPRRR